MSREQKKHCSVFPQGEELKSEHFCGKVWLQMLVNRDKTFNCPYRQRDL